MISGIGLIISNYSLVNSFIKQYRLPQILAQRLIQEIRPFVLNDGQIPLHLQVLTTLNFYASGSYQLCVLYFYIFLAQHSKKLIHYFDLRSRNFIGVLVVMHLL